MPVEPRTTAQHMRLACFWPTRTQGLGACVQLCCSAGLARPLAHVLVATDAAVRGVDVALPAGLALLVSYDCPTRKACLCPSACALGWSRVCGVR